MSEFNKRHIKRKIFCEVLRSRVFSVEMANTLKRKHQVLTIADKIKILERLDKGESRASLSKQFDVGTSTISDIKKAREKLQKYASSTENGPGKRKTLKQGDNPELEEVLYSWFVQERSQSTPISGDMIAEKARFLFEKMKCKGEFRASKGWVDRFKSRYGIRLTGEKLSNYFSVFEPGKQKFKRTVEKVCDADESGLHWRVLPHDTEDAVAHELLLLRRAEPICLDIAINQLTLDLLNEKFQKEDIYATDSLSIYYEEDGIPRLKQAAADFFTKYFHSVSPVMPDNLTFISSVGGCMDLLGHCLADPGDVFLAFAPMYSRIPINFACRAGVQIWPVPLRNKEDGETESFHLSVEKLKKAFDAATQAKKNVKGIFFTNPGNPVGDVMTPEFLTDILDFAAERNLHVIMDEIYALFVHDDGVQFRSVLSLPNLPDPERTHLIYGLSKDFGLTAWRVGIIHCFDPTLNKLLSLLARHQTLPLPIMEASIRILTDYELIDHIAKDIPKVAHMHYEYVCDRLREMGLEFRPSAASFFVWFYMGSLMKEVTFEEEEALTKDLQNTVNLYVAPGKSFICSDPGWFRLVFTVTYDQLVEGMDRLETYIKSRVLS